MPPFTFGQQIGRSVRQASQQLSQTRSAAREREAERRRREAMMRLRRQRLQQQAEQARKDREVQRRRIENQQDRFQAEMDFRRRKMQNRKERFQTKMDLQQQGRNERTASVPRSRLGLPGEGSVEMSPGSLAQLRATELRVGARQDQQNRRGFTQLFSSTMRGQAALPTESPFQSDGPTPVEDVKDVRSRLATSLESLNKAASTLPQIRPELQPQARQQVEKLAQNVARTIQTMNRGIEGEVQKRAERLSAPDPEAQSKRLANVLGSASAVSTGAAPSEETNTGRVAREVSNPDQRQGLANEVLQFRQFQSELQPFMQMVRSTQRAVPGGTGEGASPVGKMTNQLIKELSERDLSEMEIGNLLDATEQFRKFSKQR